MYFKNFCSINFEKTVELTNAVSLLKDNIIKECEKLTRLKWINKFCKDNGFLDQYEHPHRHIVQILEDPIRYANSVHPEIKKEYDKIFESNSGKCEDIYNFIKKYGIFKIINPETPSSKPTKQGLSTVTNMNYVVDLILTYTP